MKFRSGLRSTVCGVRRPLRLGILALALLAVPVAAIHAQVNFGIGIGLPGVSIGINLSQPPQFVRVPGYPAYYAPQLQANLFFYDGLYWVYADDNWYTGAWYNGPWTRVMPQYVPLYVLRIPVRYYRAPPGYFRRWRSDAPPRWDEHWGDDWARDHRGWDRWDRRNAPAPAPLPIYQRKFSGDRYPAPERQQELHRENYRYQPNDPMVREHFQPPPAQRGRPGGDEAHRQPSTAAPGQQQRTGPDDRGPPQKQDKNGPGKGKKDEKEDDKGQGRGR